MEENKTVRLKFFGIGKIYPYIKQHTGTMLIIALMSAVGSLVDIIMPLFQRYAIDHFIGERTLDTLLWFIILYVIVLIVQNGAAMIMLRMSGINETRVNRDLRATAFNHLQTLSFSYFNQNSVGYIHSRVMSDTARIGELFSWSLLDCVWNIIYTFGAVVSMFLIYPRLALLVVAVLPVSAVFITVFYRKLVAVNRKIREKNSEITGNYNEGITGAKTIKSLAVEGKMFTDFKVDTAKMKHLSVRSGMFSAGMWSAVSFFAYLALAFVLWRGGILNIEGVVKLGVLQVFMQYSINIMQPILGIVDAISSLINTQVNIERFTTLVEMKSDVADSDEVTAKYGDTFEPKKENWEEIKGDIEFDDVTFMYPDGEENVLEHFSLKVPAGTNVAIVGETGAGKSTLVNLVCRFFEPTEGKVLIDGRDARERSQLWLHSSIGYVLQTPHLFSGTVRENLLYGNPTATEDEIKTALERVSATAVVDKMDGGLDANVGEGGDLLSTGEKQLISFARALLANPRILVLDEATSSIDTVTEQKIQRAIGEVIKGRTSFVIAHRLSTIREADIILVVRDGKIVERGTHKELMKLGGYYNSLYTRQFAEEAVSGVLGGEREYKHEHN